VNLHIHKIIKLHSGKTVEILTDHRTVLINVIIRRNYRQNTYPKRKLC